MAIAIDERPALNLRSLHPLWHDDAPRAVVKKSIADDPFSAWKQWQKHLSRRRDPEAPPFLDGKAPPILWGWPQRWQRDAIQNLFSAKKNKRVIDLGMAAARLLSVGTDHTPDLPSALQFVALAYALPQLSAHMSAEHWWQLVEQLHNLACEAEPHRVDWPADPTDVIRQQLLAGELPLALAYLFPEVRALREHRKTARAALTEGLVELTDGQGLPHARLLPVLGPLFALWTRSRWLGARLKRGAWSAKAEGQYEWLVRHALRLVDHDGRFLLSPHDDAAPAWTPSMFHVAVALAGDRRDRASAATVISKSVVPKRAKYKRKNLPDASLNSDWAGIAVMSDGWKHDDTRIAVNYAETAVQFELSVRGERVMSGPWNMETTCDGQPVKIVGEWDRLCWESDNRYSYLELGVELSHGLRLERQFLLGQKDRVLYLVDILKADDGEPRRLHHSVRLPLEQHVAWQPEFETRDGVLSGSRTRAAVMPLALSEWRSDPRGGSLSTDYGQLVLTQEVTGRALCCPLLLDLDRKRSKLERTWRQLTVAEWMEIIPHDLAVAYRAQSGDDQWLYYRSLGPAGNRTFLGQNIAGEFSAGSFRSDGKYKEWIEVEAAE